MPEYVTIDQVRLVLRRVTWNFGYQSHWARAHGFDPGYVSAVINGYRRPNERLLETLGFREHQLFEPLGRMEVPIEPAVSARRRLAPSERRRSHNPRRAEGA